MLRRKTIDFTDLSHRQAVKRNSRKLPRTREMVSNLSAHRRIGFIDGRKGAYFGFFNCYSRSSQGAQGESLIVRFLAAIDDLSINSDGGIRVTELLGAAALPIQSCGPKCVVLGVGG